MALAVEEEAEIVKEHATINVITLNGNNMLMLPANCKVSLNFKPGWVRQ